jgi:hypothetical protein
MPELTDEQKEIVGLALGSLNAYVPNLRAIREILGSIRGVDPKAAYGHFLKIRPKDWPTLPPFETLMEK